MTSTLAPPAARQSLWRSLWRFSLVGGASVAVDFAALALLRSGAHAPLWLATIIGYGLSLIVNYRLNHGWTFASERDHRRAITRYLALVAFNVASVEAIVLGLHAAGVYYLLAKLIAAGVNACVNFVGFRYWVFA